MNNNYQFFKTEMPSSRLSDYYLGCLGGSVFIDFNINSNNRICLVRISFDGYGSCNIGDNANPMNEMDSNEFIAQINSNNIDQGAMSRIVIKALNDNKDQIWTDALMEYELL